MVFPSISVSPHPLHPPPPPPSHEDPTSLGRDVLPLKLHGEFLLLPSSAPSAACNCILRHSTPPPLPLICLLVYFQHILQRVCAVIPLGGKNPKEEYFLFSHLLFFWLCFLQTPSIVLCMLSFCSRMIQHVVLKTHKH